MEKYQIVDCGADFLYAGTKATQDVADIAEKMGYRRCSLRMRSVKASKAARLRRQAGYYADWKRCCREIPAGALVLLQHPFHYPQLIRERCLRRLKERGARFICLVHDVEELRGYRYSDYYKREFEFMLEIADALIVHNRVMKSFFRDRGVKNIPVIELGIFDYLQKSAPKKQTEFERKVIVAGNLDVKKSGYIGKLPKLNSVSFELFGSPRGQLTEGKDHISYRGVFPADQPGDSLSGGLGLVWDGDGLLSCSGPSGEYLRYNSPHKLSLYLSCGIPVVIWEKAAQAAFVKTHRVGICVDSLWELERKVNGLDEAAYREMAENAARMGERLREGRYTRQALERAEKSINK